MHPLDPSDHLQILAHDRALHMERQRLLRIAQARADLTRRQRRVDEAWRELVDALNNASTARHALTAIDRQ